MKFAFSSNAFKNYSLEDSIKEIAAIGYEGVELLCDIPHAYPPDFGDERIRSIRNLLSSCSLQISNLNAFTLYAIGDVYHPSWIEEEQQLRELRIQHTIDCLHLANKIGAKNISTIPGGPMVNVNSKDIPRLEKLFIDGLLRTAEIAEEQDVKILVEPEPFLFLENSTQFRNFMSKVNSEYVKLNFDIGHFFCVGEDPARLVYELSDYIGHFHLADIASSRVHNHLIPGLGAIDFAQVFRAINDIGYQGFVTVELYPYQSNPVEAAKSAFDYLSDIAK
ncbi:MAG TPA: sugar phosphate isomerase/epimerase family protein [Nitrosopumilaceae archaeon]|nr:sugar phosphate isomerase/epimerase family protein [Nitrosopumilaceae archaeon]